MVSSSPFDLAKKTKNVRTQPRKNNSIKATRRMKKKMERIGRVSIPDAEAAAEESRGESVPKIRAPPPASLSHGVVSVIGRTRRMTDAVKVVPRLEIDGDYFDFFAVYGGRGAPVCQARMHLTVAMEAEKIKGSSAAGELCRGGEYWNRVMGSSFQGMDRDVRAAAGESGRWTAVVVMVGKEELVVANNSVAGNCKAVLYRGGIALPMSAHDRHKGKPEVTVRERGESSSSEEFVVVGSKGLWDVVSNELACDVVAKCFNGGMRMRFADDTTENCAPAAAAFLAELAMARGSRENVSVIVVKL